VKGDGLLVHPSWIGISALGQTKPDPKKPEYPFNHQAGMKVPIGGSMCANCRFLSDDQKHCTNEFFVRWEGENKPAGSDVIPAPIDQFCSDWFEPAKGTMDQNEHKA
jgi:hypothetical protein